MPISLNYPVKPTAKTIRINSTLKGNDTEWVAWWYCGLYKNRQAEDQPHVLVGFRELLENNLSDQVKFSRIPLTALGQVTLGSIWKDSVCRSSVDYDTEDFEIDFSRNGWCFTSFQQTFSNRTEMPYPIHLYPLQFSTDKNWLIEFKLASGGRLIVPCLEFFSRCYGRSQELNRILATYPWKGASKAHESRLYAPLDEPEEPGKWKVKLRYRLRNGDTTFLAHAKYDPYTEEAAKSIYAQLEINFKPESTSPMFIHVGPWFEGPAEIKVKGIWFDDNRSFLALGIIGCSDPDGILILRERENTNKREGNLEGAMGEAWSGAIKKTLIRPPDIVNLTGEDEPDHGANSIEVLDNDFVVLGIPRLIVDRYGKRITNRSGIQKNGNDASAYSSGEPYGSDKGVGYASIHAKPVMESQGVLMDMWNAAHHTKAKYPNKIKSVDWYTFQDGYKSSGIPGLIALEPIDESDIPKQTRNWVFYDVATARVRGVMVIRIIVNDIPIHIIEIQRRPRIKKDQNDKEIESEESYKGFVTIIKDSGYFLQWLRRFLYDVRYVRGIVEKLTPYNPGKADAFAHSRAGGDEVPSEASVLNALKKMGITLRSP